MQRRKEQRNGNKITGMFRANWWIQSERGASVVSEDQKSERIHSEHSGDCVRHAQSAACAAMLPMFRALGVLPGGRSKQPFLACLESTAHLSGDTANIVIVDPWHADQTTLCPRYGVNLARALVRAIYYGEA